MRHSKVLILAIALSPGQANAACDRLYAQLDRTLAYALENGYSVSPSHPGIHRVPLAEVQRSLKTYENALRELSEKQSSLTARLAQFVQEGNHEAAQTVSYQLTLLKDEIRKLKKQRAQTEMKRIIALTSRDYSIDNSEIRRYRDRGIVSDAIVSDRAHKPGEAAIFDPKPREVIFQDPLKEPELEVAWAHELAHGKANAAPRRIKRDKKGRLRGHAFNYDIRAMAELNQDQLLMGYRQNQHASEALAFHDQTKRAIKLGKDDGEVFSYLQMSTEAAARNHLALESAQKTLSQTGTLTNYRQERSIPGGRLLTYRIPCSINDSKNPTHWFQVSFELQKGDQEPTLAEFDEYLGFLLRANEGIFEKNEALIESY